MLNAICFGIGGLIGLVWTARQGFGVLRGISWKVYAFGTLGLFGYHALYFAAFTRAPPVAVNLITYLWPLLIVIFAVWIPNDSPFWLPTIYDTTLKVTEENLGVPRRVARFVCTLGATANMNGTALFEGITVLFLAQFFGIELSLVQQMLVVLMCVLGGIGAAGVPGGSLPVIAMILAMFGIPPEGIGLILGVDRLLDMCRTVVNVGGDMVGSVVIGRSEEGVRESPPAPAAAG